MTRRLVVGLGNPLAGDEGVGGRIIEELERRYDCSGIDTVDLGTSLFSLLHLLDGRTKAVIVDCALMGEPPGAIRRFNRSDARSIKTLRRVSLHEGDLFDIIDLACGEDGRATEIVFFGIEPERIEIGVGLSAALERRLETYTALIAAEAGIGKKTVADA